MTSIDIETPAEEEKEDESGKIDVNASNFMFNTYAGKKRFNLELSNGTSNDQAEDQLLQISQPNKILLYDLKHELPKEVDSIFDTSFFVAQENFVDLGLDDYWVKINNKWTQVVSEKTRDLYQMCRIDEESANISNRKYISLVKNYSAMDFQTLAYLAFLLKRDHKLEDWPQLLSSFLVSFKGHNLFSIFNKNEHHETLLEFVLAQMEEMRAENEIKRIEEKDTPFDRRIYRIMKIATPNFPKSDVDSGTQQTSQISLMDQETNKT